MKYDNEYSYNHNCIKLFSQYNHSSESLKFAAVQILREINFIGESKSSGFALVKINFA